MKTREELTQELFIARTAIRRWSGENGNALKLHIALGAAMVLEWMLGEADERPTDGLGDE